MQRISLVATVHDPGERLLPAIRKNMGVLSTLFSFQAVAVTSETNPKVKRILAESGVRLVQTVENEVGTSRRMAVKLALEDSCDYLLYCDFDRMLHWVSTYPHELELLIEKVGIYDYLVIGRTKRAFDSHPVVQKKTEQITNYVFWRVSGRAYDVTTGASVMSRSAAENILRYSQTLTNATDTEWPTIVLRFFSGVLGYVEVEGMEFETPDFYESEITATGSYEKWLESLSAHPEKWLTRLNLCYESIEVMIQLKE